jgi:hypothetical protein
MVISLDEILGSQIDLSLLLRDAVTTGKLLSKLGV